jgi:hypothetical protein
MDIPASMQTLIGERILRFGTSYNRERFFLDIPAADRNDDRTRFGYYLPGGRIVRSLGIEHLLGRTVLDIFDGGEEDDYHKLVFETNPDGTKLEYCIFWLEIIDPTEEAFWLLEEGVDEEWELEEDGTGGWLLEESSGASGGFIQDTTIPKNIYSNVDSDEKFYIIQEDDFREPEDE